MYVFARALPQQNWTTDQPANQKNERDISHAHSEGLASKNREKLYPRELLIWLFPTQRHGVL